jgi:LmbE family N-acetylglucosaminyl deacetylase
MPYWDDRHPDHVASSHVLRTAVFTSGLRRYESAEEPWRPQWVCYYFINDGATPSFVVDVSVHYQRKRDALDCYRSQFAPNDGGAVATRLTASTFRQLIESRDAQFGALAGVAFAEGVVVREPVRRAGLLKDAP